MSLVPPIDPVLTFGAGGAEPWESALRGSGRSLTLVADETAGTAVELDRWATGADDADRTTLAGLTGPVLDVGCGPGRMVRAALDAGLNALGVDVSPAAVERCAAEGLPVLHRSVFAPLPREGAWSAVLLLDGNVGIGGAVPLLLARCADLLAPGGVLVAETHADPDRDRTFVGALVDAAGARSADFPWTEVGAEPLAELARDAGFASEGSWSTEGRSFSRFRKG